MDFMAGRSHRQLAPYSADPVGARIRHHRQRQGLTQMQLAVKANVNQGYLSSIERGDRTPRPSTLRAIAVALGVPEAVLLGEGDAVERTARATEQTAKHTKRLAESATAGGLRFA